ncbi:unnamed protein product [Heterobilharzia americana]|nr:unnamed protein product [Heterobilharzia americana]
MNAQLAKLSILHAQQLNIQVLLEREWLKLHKINSMKMAKYGYSDVAKNENYNSPQLPFNPRYSYVPKCSERFTIHSPEIYHMNALKNPRDYASNLNKQFRSVDCGLNKNYTELINDNRLFISDTLQERTSNNNNNIIEDDTSQVGRKHVKFSPNNNNNDIVISKTRNSEHKLNVPIPGTRQHHYLQDSSFARLHISPINNYSNYQKTTFKESLPYESDITHLSKMNHKKSIAKVNLTSEHSHSYLSRENDEDYSLQQQQQHKSFPLNQRSIEPLQFTDNTTGNNKSKLRIIPDKQNYKSTKLFTGASSDHSFSRKSSSLYLKPGSKLNSLLNLYDTRFLQQKTNNPPGIFQLRKAASQSCIYDKAFKCEDLSRHDYSENNLYNNNLSIQQENDYSSSIRSSIESLDQEILDLCSNDLSLQSNNINKNINNDQQCLHGLSQIVNSRFLDRVHKLPKHIEVDKEKEYERSSSSTSHLSFSSVINNENNCNVDIKPITSEIQDIYIPTNHPTVSYPNHISTNDNNESNKSLCQVEKDNYRVILLHKENNKIKDNRKQKCLKSKSFDVTNSKNSSESHISTMKMSKSTVNNLDKFNLNMSENNLIACKTVAFASDEIASDVNRPNNTTELDSTRDSGISSVSRDMTISNGVIYLRKEVNHMVLGPCINPVWSVCDTSVDRDQLNAPTWLAVCIDEIKVLVYDLWTHNCLIEFMNHAISSSSCVVHIFPMYPIDIFENRKSRHFGLLCVVQKNGILTLYDIASENMAGKISLESDIYCASLVPCQGKINTYLPQAILSIENSGLLTISQWKVMNSSKNFNASESILFGETLETGTNIFKEISRKGEPVNFKYCIYIQDNLRPPTSGDSKTYMNKINSHLLSSTGFLSNHVNKNEFNLITASYECTRRKIIRLTSWLCKSKGLCNTVSYNKILSNDPNGNLIDISVAESGCSGSLCICFTSEVFWLSLHTFDILSKFKLPSFMNPIECLSSSWPQPADLNKVQHRRNWLCVNKNRLLEISPFESQRRLDAKGRACLLVCAIGPTDSRITTVASGLGIAPIIATALENGEVHITLVPESCFSCMIDFCPLGFTNKSDLVYHVVRDHYLSESIDGFRCNWSSCDLCLPLNSSQFNSEILEEHARQHVYS